MATALKELSPLLCNCRYLSIVVMGEIRAAELAGQLDRDISRWTPQRLHEAYGQHGCAVVRGAIDTATMRDVATAMDAAYETASEANVTEHDLAKVTRGKLTGFELVEGSTFLREFLDCVYRDLAYRRLSVSGRRIQGIEFGKDWQKPLDLHLDSQFHQLLFTVNFWVPFQECGIDAPSLQLVPIDVKTTRRYSGFRGSLLRQGEPINFGLFKQGAFDVVAVKSAFGEDCFYRPVMKPGDVIVSSNWIIHGSYRTPHMKKGRTSVEIRYIGPWLNMRRPTWPLLTDQIANVFSTRLGLALKRRLFRGSAS
jgi:hypothetical protein